ncbi:LssY C-terminal domain-containing protein [Candidatus Scalindua japonica]|nr:LssY C-terminal domain-containing protein [Candidatus Scalindua japonica]
MMTKKVRVTAVFGLLTLLIVWLPACQTYNPTPLEEVSFLQRSQTKAVGGLTVTAAVLSHEESEQIFGRPLAEKGIQPVWLEIKNGEELPYFLISRSLDPTYFSASEVAYMHRVAGKKTNKRIADDYRKLAIDIRIPSGETMSGFVFARFDLGTKVVPVVLFGPQQVRSVVFYIPVTGFKGEDKDIDIDNLYKQGQIVMFEEEETFRTKLAGFQCCSRDESDSNDNVPLNVVLIGNRNVIHDTLSRAGWKKPGAFSFSTSLKTAEAFFSGEFPLSIPATPQYLFGREQDISLHKGRDSLHNRNRLNLWLSPWIFKGQNVWIGNISRDIGIKRKHKSLNLANKIDPDIDNAYYYLFMDVMMVQGLAKFGVVKGMGKSSPGTPGKTLSGNPYWTEGKRAVLLLSDDRIAMNKVDFFNWDFAKSVKAAIQKLEQKYTEKE